MKEQLITGGKIASAAAGLSVPLAGLVGAAFFEVLSHRSAKKVAAILNEIDARLRALEATGILDVNDLVHKESFLDLLLTACAVAQRTQRKEKIARIRNALVSCAQHPPTPEEADSFFHLLDQLTEEHFVILQVISDHLSDFSTVSSFSDAFEVFNRFHPRLTRDAFGHYLYDLKYRRLLRISPKVDDEEGLNTTSLLALEKGSDGATFIVSEVAKQLLAITK